MSQPRQAELLEALLAHHADLARAGAGGGSGVALLQRARLLAALDRPDLAWPDLVAAGQEDPADPAILAWTCILAARLGQPAHAVALRLLASPFASDDERAQGLAALDPGQLPVLLHQALPTRLRVTLVLRDGDRVEAEGLGPGDSQQPLGRSGAGAARVTALDMFCARPGTGARPLRFVLNGVAMALDCPGLEPAPAPLTRAAGPVAPLWIVMPVCDGGPAVPRCLDALHAAMRRLPGCRLVLVDDGSRSALIRDRLLREARRPGVRLLRTGGGAGFTRAVNQGLAAVGRGPVLLLNSDTWMPAATLPRLLAHLRDPEVGTVTPLSNNAGSLSLMGPGRPCPMPPPAICTALDRAAARAHPGGAVDLPNANGFCMLISESCLHQTGPLSTFYDSGYYEEVDFSLRASALGFRHLAAIDCFVGHVGAASYGGEKSRLVAENRQRLHRNFPEYEASYGRFLRLDPLAGPRARLLADLAPAWTPEALSDPAPAGADGPDPAAPPRVFSWPQGPDLPQPLPVSGARLTALLRGHRFRRLRPLPEDRLVALGLRLAPAHGLRLDWDPALQRLRLRDGTGRARLALDCAGAGPEDLLAFEAAVLAILAKEPAHALPV